MEYALSVASVFAIMVVLAMSCYVVILSGEISFGQHAFFGIGAYVAAACTVISQSGLAIGLLAGAATSLLVALLAGMSIQRTRGFQFTIYTLIFAEFAREIMFKLEWQMTRDGRVVGPQGLLGFSGIDHFSQSGYGTLDQALLLCGVAAATVAAVAAMRSSSFGRAMEAAGSDPTLAAAVGIDHRRMRVSAFAIAGGIAGLGGGMFAHFATYINPENFSLMFGVHAVAYTLLGGIGSVLGPILGAAVDIILLEQLRIFGGYRMIVFGALIVLVIIARPAGLLSRPLPVLFRDWRRLLCASTSRLGLRSRASGCGNAAALPSPRLAVSKKLVVTLFVLASWAPSLAAGQGTSHAHGHQQQSVEHQKNDSTTVIKVGDTQTRLMVAATGQPLERRLIVVVTHGPENNPVSGAIVEVDVDMPSMPMMHRVPKVRAVPSADPGEYIATVTVEMAGEWAARVAVDRPKRQTFLHRFQVDR